MLSNELDGSYDISCGETTDGSLQIQGTAMNSHEESCEIAASGRSMPDGTPIFSRTCLWEGDEQNQDEVAIRRTDDGGIFVIIIGSETGTKYQSCDS